MSTRTSVTGTLQDSAGQPVKEAVVMITSGSHEFNDIASVTNNSGEFRLSNVVIPGTYVLQISGNNQTQTREISLTDSSNIRIKF